MIKLTNNDVKLKIFNVTDDLIDEIIETVLKFVDSDTEVDEDEDGTHVTVFYSVTKGCENAVREVLNDRSKKS